MPDKRLVDFPAKITPAGSDIIFFGDASDSFREVKTTLDQERTYTPRVEIASSQNIDATLFGKNLINNSGSPVVLTIPLNSGFPVTSQFDMIRNSTGAYTLQAAVGVTINGFSGASVVLSEQYDRLVATNIQDNEWTVIQYSQSNVPVPSVPAFGEMYFNGNATETTIVTQGVPVKINATYSADGTFLSDFTQNAGTLTYTGTTKKFNISLTASSTFDLVSETASLLIAKNGVVIAKSQQTSFLGSTSPAEQVISCQAFGELTLNDTLEAFIQNDTSDDNITVTQLNISSLELQGGTTGIVDIGSGNPGLVIGTLVDASSPSITSQFYTRINNVVTLFVFMAIQADGGEPSFHISVPFSPSFTGIHQANGNGNIERANLGSQLDDSRFLQIESVSSSNDMKIKLGLSQAPQALLLRLTLTYQIQS